MTSVYIDILEWSKSRPEWQRDALRRLIDTHALSKNDIEELVEICLTTVGIAKRTAQPLLTADLPDGGGEVEGRVQADALFEIEDIDALHAHAALEFAPTGLTLIYGTNGAGKSSYARILKKLCRARGSGRGVRNNVYSTSTKASRATMTYTLDGLQQQFEWMESVALPAALTGVSVFDSHAALAYVSEKTDVAYRPAGLDLLPKLAEACKSVSGELKRAQRQIKDTLPPLPVNVSDHVAEFLRQLSNSTTDDEVNAAANFSADDATTLGLIQSEIAALQSPERESSAKAHEDRANRLRRGASLLEENASTLDELAIEELRRLTAQTEAVGTTAMITARESFANQPIQPIGSALWQSLMSAAQAYFEEEASPEQQFPGSVGSHCVLCQQSLSADAHHRLTQFRDFIATYTRVAAEEADRALATAERQIKNADVRSHLFEALLHELQNSKAGSEEAEAAVALHSFIEAAELRQQAALAALTTGEWASIPELPTAPTVELRAIGAVESERAKALRDPGHAKRLIELKMEEGILRDRQTLAQHLPSLKAYRDGLIRIAKYDECISQTHTNAISTHSGKLMETAVSAALKAAFEAELKQLGVKYLPVALSNKGTHVGEPLHQVELHGTSVLPGEVASEGESRMVALISFFTELSSENSGSAVVFDDPVSSLDRNYSDAIAARIIETAITRQTIVFTHDSTFAVALHGHAQQRGVGVKSLEIRRNAKATGFVVKEPSWVTLKTSTRIGQLTSMLQDARTSYNRGEVAEYEEIGCLMYGRMRETWERAIEEVLLNGAVERFQFAVKTQSLAAVDITEADKSAIAAGMSKCSKWLPGHDESPFLGEPFPDPKDLAADLDALKSWVKAVRDRRKK